MTAVRDLARVDEAKLHEILRLAQTKKWHPQPSSARPDTGQRAYGLERIGVEKQSFEEGSRDWRNG